MFPVEKHQIYSVATPQLYMLHLLNALFEADFEPFPFKLTTTVEPLLWDTSINPFTPKSAKFKTD